MLELFLLPTYIMYCLPLAYEDGQVRLSMILREQRSTMDSLPSATDHDDASLGQPAGLLDGCEVLAVR